MRLLGEPACHRRRVPVSYGPAQHRECQPVDLEEDDPRPVGAFRASLPARDPLNDFERVRVVVVRAENHLEHEADGGDDERGEQRPAEAVDDVGAVDEIASDFQHDRVEHEDEDEAERNREGKPQRGEQGRQDRVQGGNDQRHEERASEVSTATPGRMSAANQSAAAVRSHESRSLDTLKRGRSGCQVSASA